jgi:hypothetical protein
VAGWRLAQPQPVSIMGKNHAEYKADQGARGRLKSSEPIFITYSRS